MNQLFSRDGLWFNENIHNNLMSKIFSFLTDIKSEDTLNQDEYIIQSIVDVFLSGKLRNTEYYARREWRGIDNAVFSKAKEEPIVLYEIKSYIKPHEKNVSKKDIMKDIIKLAIKKREYGNIDAYILIAGNSKVIKNSISKFDINIGDKINNIKSRKSTSISMQDMSDARVEQKLLDKVADMGIKKISIRPSRWKNYGEMCVLTWRINKV